jgi:hypothetical protein
LDKRQQKRAGNELKVKDFKNSSQVSSAFATLSKAIGNSDATQDMAVELKVTIMSPQNLNRTGLEKKIGRRGRQI